MKFAFALIFVLSFTAVLSLSCAGQSSPSIQLTTPPTAVEWHAGSDSLQLPGNGGNFYPSMGSFIQYDTVVIVYQTDNNEYRNGYKRIHLKHGYYIDDASTMQVFFDEHLRRVANVIRYRFL